jgi:hypothetical protein
VGGCVVRERRRRAGVHVRPTKKPDDERVVTETAGQGFLPVRPDGAFPNPGTTFTAPFVTIHCLLHTSHTPALPAFYGVQVESHTTGGTAQSRIHVTKYCRLSARNYSYKLRED